MGLGTSLTRMLGIQLPIIQAPMAGGATTAALVAEVSNAGALGSLAASALSPEQLLAAVGRIRRKTDAPFAVNLFVQSTPSPSLDEIETAWARLASVHEELEISPELPATWCQPFDEQFEALLEARPAVASFTFGILDGLQVSRLHDAGILIMGNATQLEEAEAWAQLGADVIVAQGAQAGGHRGTFIGRQDEALVDTAELVESCVENLDVPVVAAGGIMDGYDIAVQLGQGAQAVQMGTAFLATPESGIVDAWKQALVDADGETRLTRAFSGRLARGLPNRAMRLLGRFEEKVPAYPVQNALTQPFRSVAAKREDADYLSLWAGKGVARIRQLAAEELIAVLAAELEAAKQAQALD